MRQNDTLMSSNGADVAAGHQVSGNGGGHQGAPGSRKRRGVHTRSVHAGEPVPVDGAIVAPIFQTATFRNDGLIRYTRHNNNPSTLYVTGKIASLESAAAACVTASGMASISTTLLTLLKAGDHMLIQHELYGGTNTWVEQDLPDCGVTYTKVDISKPKEWEASLKPNTKVFYAESLSNPLMTMPDIKGWVAFSKKHHLITVIDNTVASPCIFRPIEHGVDIVIESCTKYMNGHCDVIAGSVAGSDALITKITTKLTHMGGCMDPHACFLLQRGLKTMPVRVKQQSSNALALARALESHPKVTRVHYPGLESHPSHARAKEMLDPKFGFGGLLSLELDGGKDVAQRFIKALSFAIEAPSLGGVETLVSMPATSSHSNMSEETRRSMGIMESTVRVAVGIEDPEDLIADFLAAIETAFSDE